MPKGKYVVIDDKFMRRGRVYREGARRRSVVVQYRDEYDEAPDGQKREVIVLDHEKE